MDQLKVKAEEVKKNKSIRGGLQASEDKREESSSAYDEKVDSVYSLDNRTVEM